MRSNSTVLAGAMVACALLIASCANSPDSRGRRGPSRNRSQSPLVGAWVSVTRPEDRLIVRVNDASYTVEQADGTKYAAIERDGILTLQGTPGEVAVFYDDETNCLMRTWLGYTTRYVRENDARAQAAVETMDYPTRVRYCRAYTKMINTAVQAYFAQNKEWPKQVTDMLSAGDPASTTPPGFKGGQLTEPLTCPFGRPYRLVEVREWPNDPGAPLVGMVVDWRDHWDTEEWQRATTHLPEVAEPRGFVVPVPDSRRRGGSLRRGR